MAGFFTAVSPLVMILVFGCISGSAGSDICTTSPGYYPLYLSSTRYCRYGCCGTYPYENCCTFNVARIVGGSIGALFSVLALISFCCFWRRRRRTLLTRSTATTTATAPSVAVVSSNASNTYQYPNNAYGQPMGNAYSQPIGVQSAYGQPMGHAAYSQPMGNAYGQPMGVQPTQSTPYYPTNAAAPPPSYEQLAAGEKHQ